MRPFLSLLFLVLALPASAQEGPGPIAASSPASAPASQPLILAVEPPGEAPGAALAVESRDWTPALALGLSLASTSAGFVGAVALSPGRPCGPEESACQRREAASLIVALSSFTVAPSAGRLYAGQRKSALVLSGLRAGFLGLGLLGGRVITEERFGGTALLYTGAVGATLLTVGDIFSTPSAARR
jgi:hypothetical protein